MWQNTQPQKKIMQCSIEHRMGEQQQEVIPHQRQNAWKWNEKKVIYKNRHMRICVWCYSIIWR